MVAYQAYIEFHTQGTATELITDNFQTRIMNVRRRVFDITL